MNQKIKIPEFPIFIYKFQTEKRSTPAAKLNSCVICFVQAVMLDNQYYSRGCNIIELWR